MNNYKRMSEFSGTYNGVQFLTNKNGFPLDHDTWERMFEFAKFSAPERSKEIDSLYNNAVRVGDVPCAAPTVCKNSEDHILATQAFMNKLQYNHTGTQFFDIRKNRPLSGYLTSTTKDVDRFTIGFKSVCNGSTFRHVVLGLQSAGVFGALGMSRRDDLMYKPFSYGKLSDLIFDYKRSYEKYAHTLKTVKIGLPINHDVHCHQPVPWKGIVIDFCDDDIEAIRQRIDRHSRTVGGFREFF